jgi:DNA adenine methylase
MANNKQMTYLDDVEVMDSSSRSSRNNSNLQLLKWVGNKQRFASEIISFFPDEFRTYHEPFLGSGAVLAKLAPKKGIGSDSFKPLIQIFQTLQKEPERLIKWYSDRWNEMAKAEKKEAYEKIKASYNANPNPADLLFISRSCYGGVVRFRKLDGYISTPVGPHDPISPVSFARRVDLWHRKTVGTKFLHMEYEEAMKMAKVGDLIYCDPPYTYSQSILYGAHAFSLSRLLEIIGECKKRGVFVALSIDGTKRSGNLILNLPIPDGLFEREVFLNTGRSMLKRLQMNGKTLENEVVSDRLLLTY